MTISPEALAEWRKAIEGQLGDGPWTYQERSDAYTHIVRGPGNEFIVQLSQGRDGKAEARGRFIALARTALPEAIEALEQAEAREAERVTLLADVRKALDVVASKRGQFGVISTHAQQLSWRIGALIGPRSLSPDGEAGR